MSTTPTPQAKEWAVIVTLYRGQFYDGLGAVVTLEAGDTLTRREPDDDSFELKRKGAFDERVYLRDRCIQRLREKLRELKAIAEAGLEYGAPPKNPEDDLVWY